MSSEKSEDSASEIDLVAPLTRLRTKLDESLRAHQPLVVLASLSVAAAAFLRAASPDAAILAATGGVVFLTALAASVLSDLAPSLAPALVAIPTVGFAAGLAFIAAALLVIIAGVAGAIIAVLLVWSIANFAVLITLFSLFRLLEKVLPAELKGDREWRLARRSLVLALLGLVVQFAGNAMFFVPGMPTIWTLAVTGMSTVLTAIAGAFVFRLGRGRRTA